MATLPSVPSQSAYDKLSTSAQNAFWVSYFTTFPGTVTTAWVKSNAALAPYEGDSAVAMYEALAKTYPTATPQQRGSTVYQAWLGAGATQAIGESVVTSGTSLGDVATGVETASILPSWATGLADILGDLESANLWIRLGKVVVGALLIIVAVSKMTGVSNVVTDVAGKVPVIP